MHDRPLLSALVAGLALAGLPAATAAQMCSGVPNSARELTVQARHVTTEGIDSYGAMVHFNSPGYLSAGIGWMLDDLENEEDHGHTILGKVAVELDPEESWPVGVCVVTGAEYNNFSTEFSLGDFRDRRISLLAGVGVGKEVALTPAVSLGGWAIPVLHYVSAEQEIRSGGFITRMEDESTGLAARFGAALSFHRFHLSGEYTYFDVEGVEDTFGVALGYDFRIP